MDHEKIKLSSTAALIIILYSARMANLSTLLGDFPAQAGIERTHLFSFI